VKPTTVRCNDWRQVDVEPLETFTPTLPVSVVMPSWRTPPETLAMTLATLEGQTYPRDLFEVVIVDDGSEPPLRSPPTSTNRSCAGDSETRSSLTAPSCAEDCWRPFGNPSDGARAVGTRARTPSVAVAWWDRLRNRVRDVRSPSQAGSFAKRAAAAAGRKTTGYRRREP